MNSLKPGAFRYLPYLRCFEAVARCGSLRDAASELGLSPGAVSLQLRKLADATRLDLFARDGRRLILTAEGRRYHVVVRQSLADLDHEVFGDRQTIVPPSRLSISLPPSLNVAWLGAAVIEFCQSRQIAEVRIISTMDAALLDWTGLDLAVVYDQPPFVSLWWSLIRETRLRTVCALRVMTAIERQRGGRSLRGHTLLHEDDGQEWLRWSQAASISLEGTGNIYLPSIGQAVSCARNGLGLALVSDVLAGDDLRTGDLAQPFPVMIPGSRAYYFLSRPSDAKNTFHRDLRNDIMRRLWARIT